MSRSVIKPHHQAQLGELRAWARKQGKTPPAITNAEREAREKAQAQTADVTSDNPSKPSPETSEGNDET